MISRAGETFNPIVQESEAGEPQSSRLASSTERVPEQPGLHRDHLFTKTKPNEQKEKKNTQITCSYAL